jgi:para-nitrobenzyl esterase
MDGALFAFLQFVKAPKSLGSANASDYHTFLTENFGPAASLIEHNYPVSAFNSTSMPAFYAISAVLGEANYICTARRALNTTSAAGVPVWAYNFAHVPNCSWLPGVPQNVVPLLGPTHTAEIPFVFGHTVQHPTSNSSCNMTQAERTISRFMMDAWTSMAVNQKPTMNSSYWPPYKDAKQSLGMNIVNASVPGYIDYASCALWDEVNQILENDSNHNTTTASNSTATIKGAISGQVGSGVMVYGIVLLATAMFVIF